jgi:excisionase family DNA binding protein
MKPNDDANNAATNNRDDFPPLLSRHDAAEALDISVRKLDQLKANRQINFVEVGRCVKFSHADLQQFVDTNRVKAMRN